MPASLTEEELAMLEALEARVTPTPWRVGNVELDGIFVAATHADRMGPERVLLRMNQRFNGYDLDAQFIAATRNALPALLASARKLAAISKIIDRGGAYATRLDLMMALRGALEHGGFPCCGGSDEHPPEHTQGCETQALTATAEPTDGEER